jgi:valyl-tRNA synthetase
MMPFITEEIWQDVAPRLDRHGDTIMLAQWPSSNAEEVDASAESDIEWLKTVIAAVRTIRSEANIPPGEGLEVLFGNATETDKANVEKLGQSLEKMAKIKHTTMLENSDERPPALSALAGTLEVMVPMAGVVDIEKELTRLDKELERMKTEQARIATKLGNQNFVDRAPQAVVDKEKLKLEELETGISSISAQKSKIEELR